MYLLHRYYAKEIQMHSYDNGNALKAKRDNWNQLLKVFRKIGLPHIITEEEADFILRCEDNAAISFVTRIYETLTQRKIQTQVKKPSLGRPAGYAKETGSWKVREALRKNDIREDSDQLMMVRKTSAIVEEHERSLQEERSLDPERFSIATSIGARSVQLPPKDINDDEMETPQVRVKEIQVRQLDRNVTHLRASKQMQGNSNIGAPSSVSKGFPRSVTPSGSKTVDKVSAYSSNSPNERYEMQSVAGGMLPENAMSVINACISRILNPENLISWSPDKEPYLNFMSAVELLRGGADLDSVIAATLAEIQLSAQQLAEACAVTPKQFWRVSDMFCTVLITTSHHSESSSAAVESFEAVGRWMAQRDPKSSLALFCDFALFKLAGTITINHHKRLGLLRVLLAFTPLDSQSKVQCIKRLQSILVGDINVFIVCLTILAAHETQMDDTLLDLYLYYGTIALGLPSPKMRAGAVLVFSSLLPQAEDIIVAMLPQLSLLAEQEGWWEIHAHLLSLVGSLLRLRGGRGPATDSEESKMNTEEMGTMELALGIVNKIFGPSSPKNQRHWGLLALAPGLICGETLAALYLKVLVGLDDSDRRFFLGLGHGKDVMRVPLPSSTGIPFILEPVVGRWHPLPVARAILTAVKRGNLDRLEPETLEVLYATVKSTAETAAPHGASTLHGPWLELFTALKDYIFVGFCDQESCRSAAGIMTCYMSHSPLREGVLREGRFLGILRLLYPEDDEGNSLCQSVVESFLRDTANMGEPYTSMVLGIIEQFAKSFTTQYERSDLQDILKEFGSEY